MGAGQVPFASSCATPHAVAAHLVDEQAAHVVGLVVYRQDHVGVHAPAEVLVERLGVAEHRVHARDAGKAPFTQRLVEQRGVLNIPSMAVTLAGFQASTVC